jgi:hypothetical protein
MTAKKISCAVVTQGDLGVYANSFRVLQDGPEVVLDFCVYSESENVAKMVSRIRVSPSFLRVINSRIEESIDPGNLSNQKFIVLGLDNTEQ